jgi:hypothetical protein
MAAGDSQWPAPGNPIMIYDCVPVGCLRRPLVDAAPDLVAGAGFAVRDTVPPELLALALVFARGLDTPALFDPADFVRDDAAAPPAVRPPPISCAA